MRQVVGTVLLAMTFLAGCASSKPTVAKVPVAPHISVAMDEETQRALLGQDDVPVGTTTLTSAELDAAPEAVGLTPALRTWGVNPVDVDGIPTSRE